MNSETLKSQTFPTTHWNSKMKVRVCPIMLLLEVKKKVY